MPPSCQRLASLDSLVRAPSRATRERRTSLHLDETFLDFDANFES